jgi:hypothetical protein
MVYKDDWKFATIGIPAVEANYNEIIQAGKNGTFATEGTIVLEHELVSHNIYHTVRVKT